VTGVRPTPELAPLFAVKVAEYTSAVPTGVEPASVCRRHRCRGPRGIAAPAEASGA
jgi:hypothetical protein